MVPIRQMLVSPNMYYCKCPYAMTPTRIIVHNTYNDAPARNEVSYMRSNGNYTSFHVAVDDVEIVQGIPFNRNAFSAGDGVTGTGNRQGIAIEICYSKSGGSQFDKAEDNAAQYIVYLLKEFGWDINAVTKHQDYMDKYCPHRTLDKGWQRFLDMVSKHLGTSTDMPKPNYDKPVSKTKYDVDTPVCVNTIWTQANGGTKYTGDWQGKITKVIAGTEHPYLINNGDIGWTNDAAIDSDPHTPNTSAKPTAKPSAPSAKWKAVKEIGTFIPNQYVEASNEPTQASKMVAYYKAGMEINYDSYVKNDGYVFVSYISDSGVRRYVPCRNISTNIPLGTFK